MKRKYNFIPFIISLSITSAFSFYLFYKFCNTNHVTYISDFQWHLLGVWSFVNRDIFPISKHPFPALFSYPLFHWLSSLVAILINRIDVAVPLVIVISNTLTSFLLRFIANKELKSIKERYIVDFISVSFLFLMPISGPLTEYKPFFPQLSINPWHNPTYMFMRPFTLITFIYFLKVIDDVKDNFSITKKRNLFIFSLSLILSTLAKPSFTIVFLFAAGIYVFYTLFPNFHKNMVKFGFPILLSVIPTLILLLAQNYLVVTFSTITFDMKLLSLDFLSKNGFLFFRYFISLQLLNIIFFIKMGRKLLFKDIPYTLSFLMLVPSAFIWFFTTQGIVTLSNFAWSYEIATFYLLFYSVIYTIKLLNSSKISYIIYFVYFIFLYYGIKYFSYLLTGWNFTAKF